MLPSTSVRQGDQQINLICINANVLFEREAVITGQHDTACHQTQTLIRNVIVYNNLHFIGNNEIMK